MKLFVGLAAVLLVFALGAALTWAIAAVIAARYPPQGRFVAAKA